MWTRPKAISVFRSVGLTVSLCGPALAQLGVEPEDFEWEGPTAGGTRYGLYALLFVALVILVAYLWHRMRRGAHEARAQRWLSARLDQIHGFMDYPGLLEPGVRVLIEVDQGDTQRLYSSVVEEADARRAELAVPREEGVIVPLRIGQRVGLVVRKDAYSYRFETRIVGRRKGELPTVTVVNKKRVLRFQRRAFPRATVSLEADVGLRYAGGATSTPHVTTGRIVDLSGCGMRIELGVSTKRLRYVEVSIDLPDGKKDPVTAECRVIPANVQHHGPHGGMTVGVQFIQISRPHRERLVRYVRELERKARKREAERRD